MDKPINPADREKMRQAFEAIRRGDYAERDRIIAEMKAAQLAENIKAFHGNGKPIVVPGRLVRGPDGTYRGTWG